jgi:hypothetical protein
MHDYDVESQTTDPTVELVKGRSSIMPHPWASLPVMGVFPNPVYAKLTPYL